MTWRDNLRPASFRDVRFFVQSITTTDQINADEHLFPGQSEPTKAARVVYLGEGPLRYTIDAYVVGPNYHEQRDALRAALRERRPGRLVHPYQGERTVSIIGNIATTENPSRGGFARIRFECVDVSESGLRTDVDAGALLARDTQALAHRASAEVAPTLKAVDKSDVEAEWTLTTRSLADVGSALSETSSEIRVGIDSPFASVDGLLSAPQQSISALASAADALVSIPSRASNTLLRGRTLAEQAFGIVRRTLLLPLEFPWQKSPGIHAFRVWQARNGLTQVRAIISVLGGVSAASSGPFSSAQDALSARDSVVNFVDRIRPQLHPAIAEEVQRVRSRFIDFMGRSAGDLPRVERIELLADEPALSFAHREMGSALEVDALLARNQPRDASRLAAHSAMEVLR